MDKYSINDIIATVKKRDHIIPLLGTPVRKRGVVVDSACTQGKGKTMANKAQHKARRAVEKTLASHGTKVAARMAKQRGLKKLAQELREGKVEDPKGGRR